MLSLSWLHHDTMTGTICLTRAEQKQMKKHRQQKQMQKKKHQQQKQKQMHQQQKQMHQQQKQMHQQQKQKQKQKHQQQKQKQNNKLRWRYSGRTKINELNLHVDHGHSENEATYLNEVLDNMIEEYCRN